MTKPRHQRPTIERLQELLAYDPATGALTWRGNFGGKRVAGNVAGTTKRTTKNNLYVVVKVDYTIIGAHIVAWALMTGAWPNSLLDHKNGDGRDNRWENLREATWRINAQNMGLSSRNKLGVQGVVQMPGGTFRATIVLGSYGTETEAEKVYAAAHALLRPGAERTARGFAKMGEKFSARMNLGHFPTVGEASDAYRQAKALFHEGFVPSRGIA